jgi:hypothetical protein
MSISVRHFRRPAPALTAFAIAAVFAVAPNLYAQSTWDGGGGDNNWGTANNWGNNQVPAFPADLAFDGGTRLAPANNLTNPVVRNLSFAAGAGAFVIGGNAFTLGDDAMADYRDGGIDHLDDSLQTINNNITLARGHHDIVTTSGALTLNGTFSRNVAAGVQFMPAAGANIKTTLINTSGLIGGWATIKNHTPAFPQETYLYAKVDGSGNVVPYLDYTANENIDGFAGETVLPVGVNATTNIRWFGGPTAAEDLILGVGVTDLNTFLYEGPQTYLARVQIGVGNTLRFANGGGFFRSNPDGVTNTIGLGFVGGTITAGASNAPATLNIWKNTTVTPGQSPDGEDDNNIINFNGVVITNNPDGGAVTVVSNGSGGVRTENSDHTFTGGLYINRGVWRAQGATATTPFGMGDVHVASGAQAYINNGPIAVSNSFYLSGRGIDEAAFFVGAMRVAANSAILNGNIILTGDTRFGNRGAQATAIALGTTNQGVLLNGKVTGNFNLELSVKNDQAAATTLDGNMPTIILANATNDWGGNLTIGNGRIRVGGAGEVIPHGASKGNVILLGEGTAAARPTILTVDGLVETVNGLSASGAVAETFVTNQATTDGTIRVGGNDATSTFDGTFTDTPGFGKLHVTKIGTGAFTSTGLNAYTGDTRVFGGTMSIANATLDDLADVYVTPGAVLNLNFAGTDTVDGLFFGGVAQAAGTWGSLTSTATNKSDRFAGTGVLQVANLGTSLIPGDFDLDVDVHKDDLAIWTANAGDGGKADADFDGDSDGHDFLIWQRNLGRTTPAGPATGVVPEPATATLFALTLLGIARQRRKRG